MEHLTQSKIHIVKKNYFEMLKHPEFSDNVADKIEKIKKLGRIGYEEAIDPLLDLLKTESNDVKVHTLDSLSQICLKPCTSSPAEGLSEIIQPYAEKGDIKVRSAAIRLLSILGGNNNKEFLFNLFKDDNEVSDPVLKALGNIASKDYVFAGEIIDRIILPHKNDKVDYEKKISILGRFGSQVDDPELVSRIYAALEAIYRKCGYDKKSEVIRRIGEIDPEALDYPKRKRLIENIISASRRGDYELRSEAIRALGNILSKPIEKDLKIRIISYLVYRLKGLKVNIIEFLKELLRLNKNEGPRNVILKAHLKVSREEKEKAIRDLQKFTGRNVLEKLLIKFVRLVIPLIFYFNSIRELWKELNPNLLVYDINKILNDNINISEPYVLKALKSSSSKRKLQALKIISECGRISSEKPILKMISSHNGRIRLAALNAIAKLKTANLADVVIRMLDDRDKNIRIRAIGIAGETGNSVYCRRISFLAEDTLPDIRKAVVDSLASIGGDEADSTIIKLLNDSDEKVREAAVRALDRIDRDKVINYYVECLFDSNLSVKQNAAEALEKMGWIPPEGKYVSLAYYTAKKDYEKMAEFGNKALNELFMLYKATDKNEHGKIISAIGKTKDKNAIRNLISIYSSNLQRSNVFDLAEDNYEDYQYLALCETVLNAFSNIGSEEVTDVLTDSLKKYLSMPAPRGYKSDNFCIKILDVLKSIADKKAIDITKQVLISCYDELGNQACDALDAMEWEPDASIAGAFYYFLRHSYEKCAQYPEIIPFLLKRTKTSVSSEYTKAVFEVLSYINDPKYLNILIGGLRGRDTWEVAAKAICMLGTQAVGKLADTFSDSNDLIIKTRLVGVICSIIKEAENEEDYEYVIVKLLDFFRASNDYYTLGQLAETFEIAAGKIKNDVMIAEIINTLITSMTSNDEFIQPLCSKSLLRIGKKTIRFLVDALHKTENPSSIRIVNLLAKLNDPYALEEINDFILKNPDFLSGQLIPNELHRTFRVFISSTFSDFEMERNALQSRVFPKVDIFCKSLGVGFQPIDLRWGISEEAIESQQLLDICIDEIKRCREESAGLNFIALVGSRYGTRILPPEIPEDEFNGTLKEYGEYIYKLDENYLDKPMYVLQPCRSKKEKDYEYKMKEALLSMDEVGKYFTSITYREIEEGYLKTGDVSNTLFFSRKLTKECGEFPDRTYFDILSDGRQDERAFSLVNKVKESILALFEENSYEKRTQVYEYETTLTDTGLKEDFLDSFCTNAFKMISGMVLRDILKLDAKDSNESEIEEHKHFEERVSSLFTGRNEITGRILKYIAAKDYGRRPYAVIGDSGTGKTALLGHVSNMIRSNSKDYNNASVVTRYIGATPDSTDIRMLLKGISWQVAKIYGKKTNEASLDIDSIINEFIDLISSANELAPLIIIIDSLDQLTFNRQNEYFAWLPKTLPPNVSMIISSIPGNRNEYYSSLEEMLTTENVDLLGRMSRTESESLLSKWLAGYGRKLTLPQRAAVLDAFEVSGLPLFLKLAFEESKKWRSYEEVPEYYKTAHSDVSASHIIRNLFLKLSENVNHGDAVVSACVGFICASKNGLSDDEVFDLLSRDEKFMKWYLAHTKSIMPGITELARLYCDKFDDEVKKRRLEKLEDERHIIQFCLNDENIDDFIKFITIKNKNIKSTDIIPAVLWSRFYSDLKPYFVKKNVLGGIRTSFFHRIFYGVIREMYLNRENTVYSELSTYYYNMDNWISSEKTKTPNYKKTSEIITQLFYANQGARLQKLLTDMDFIAAKCHAGQIYDLLNDFELVLNSRNIESIDYDLLRRFAEFISSRSNLFVMQPESVYQELYQFIEQNKQGDDIEKHIEKNTKIWLKPLNATAPALNKLKSKESLILSCVTENAYFVGSAANEVRVWNNSGRYLGCFDQHNTVIKENLTSMDGMISVTLYDDGICKMWELECDGIFSGRYLRSMNSQNVPITKIVSDSMLNNVIMLESDNRIKMLKRGVITYFEQGATKEKINDILFNDKKSVILAKTENAIYMYDIENNNLQMKFHMNTGKIIGAASIEGANMVVTEMDDSIAGIWDLKERSLKRTIKVSGVKNIYSHVCAGSSLITVDDNNKVTIWDLSSGNLMYEYDIAVNSSVIAISEEGNTVVFQDNEYKVVFMDVTSGNQIQRESSFKFMTINHIAVSPDGKSAVLVSSNKMELIRKEHEKSEVMDFTNENPSEFPVQCAAVSADGNTVAIGVNYSLILVWDTVKEDYFILEGHKGQVNSLLFSSDNRLISGSSDFTVCIWDVEQRQCKDTFIWPGDEVVHIGNTGNGRLLFVADKASNAAILDINSSKLDMFKGRTGKACGYFHTTDTTYTAFTNELSNIAIWDINKGKAVYQFEDDIPSNEICVLPDGQKLLFVNKGYGNALLFDFSRDRKALIVNENEISVLSGRDGKCLYTIKSEGEIWKSVIEGFVNGHGILAAGDSSGAGYVYDISDGNPVMKLQDKMSINSEDSEESDYNDIGDLQRLCIVCGGKKAAVVNADSDISIYDMTDGKLIRTIENNVNQQKITALSARFDSEYIYTGYSGGEVKSWYIPFSFGSEMKKLDRAVASIAVSADMNSYIAGDDPDTKYFITKKRNDVVMLHKSALVVKQDNQEAKQKSFKDEPFHFYSMNKYGLLTPDEKNIVIWNEEYLDIWDLESLDKRHRFIDPWGNYKALISSVAISHDGKTVAAAIDKGVIAFWDVESGSYIKELGTYKKPITNLCYSPDDKYLASACCDKSVRIWDIRQNALLGVFFGGAPLTCCEFNSEGSKIAAIDYKGTFYLLEIVKQDNSKSADI